MINSNLGPISHHNTSVRLLQTDDRREREANSYHKVHKLDRYVQGGPKNGYPFLFRDNFGNSAPILTILSLLQAVTINSSQFVSP